MMQVCKCKLIRLLNLNKSNLLIASGSRIGHGADLVQGLNLVMSKDFKDHRMMLDVLDKTFRYWNRDLKEET